jgi:hypothetical protein
MLNENGEPLDEALISVLMLAMHVCDMPAITIEDIAEILQCRSYSTADLLATAEDESLSIGERCLAGISVLVVTGQPVETIRERLWDCLIEPGAADLPEFHEAEQRLKEPAVTQ